MNLPSKNYSDIREIFYSFLNQWAWELHFTMSFDTPVDSCNAYKEVKRWLHSQKHRFRKIKFGCILIFANPKNSNPHVHMVAVSDPRYPRRLIDISSIILRYIASSWGHNSLKHRKSLWDNRSCKITTNSDCSNERICRYLSKQKNISLDKPDQWNIDTYRKGVLESLRVRPLP